MVKTTEAYKNEQKQDLREKSYVFVYMGIINQNAREKATVYSGLTDYSNVDSAFRVAHDSSGQYATLEEGFTKVDNSNAFLPRNSSLYAKNQGLVTQYLNDNIFIYFDGLVDVDIKGLTIDFGDEYPTQFMIYNGETSQTYTKSDNSIFSCEDQFDDCEYIRIIPLAMRGGQQRLRINSMEFGVGLSFDNDSLISTQRRNTVSHVSDVLPLKAFDFTVNNLSRRFSQDNPFSFANYIQEGQKVEYKYGREIIDNAETGESHIEYIPGGKTYIKTWSSTDLQAKFSTVGLLDMMDNEYYKGKFNSLNNAFDVAFNILVDAGIADPNNKVLSTDKYYISPYLNTIYTMVKNPLPVATHKACLQMLANRTKSILCEDRDGRICLISSFIPTVTDDFIIQGNAYIVDAAAFNKNSHTYDWATLEDGYTRVDNTMYFRGRSNPLSPGIMSEVEETTYFGVSFAAAWTFNGITIEFSEHIPDSLTILAKRDGDTVDEVILYKDELKLTTYVDHVFDTVDGLVFFADISSENHYLADEFDNLFVTENGDRLYSYTGCQSRLHIRHILFSSDSGHTITNTDLKQVPTATSIEKIKDINVNYYSYNSTNEVKQLTTVEVSLGINVIKIANPAYDYRYLWEDSTLEEWSESKTYAANVYVKREGMKYKSLVANNTGHKPESSPSYWEENLDIYLNDVEFGNTGSYYIQVNVLQNPNNQKLVVYGYPMDVKYETYTRHLHDIGNNVNLKNVLISDLETAQDIADWLEEYYTNDTEYTIQYRGEPALDCDDLVYLENQFVNDNLCRIEEEEISTAIGMSLTNNMKLRRVSYGDMK